MALPGAELEMTLIGLLGVSVRKGRPRDGGREHEKSADHQPKRRFHPLPLVSMVRCAEMRNRSASFPRRNAKRLMNSRLVRFPSAS